MLDMQTKHQFSPELQSRAIPLVTEDSKDPVPYDDPVPVQLSLQSEQ